MSPQDVGWRLGGKNEKTSCCPFSVLCPESSSLEQTLLVAFSVSSLRVEPRFCSDIHHPLYTHSPRESGPIF